MQLSGWKCNEFVPIYSVEFGQTMKIKIGEFLEFSQNKEVVNFYSIFTINFYYNFDRSK